eukprot:4119597-Amphidinium_carterae.1
MRGAQSLCSSNQFLSCLAQALACEHRQIHDGMCKVVREASQEARSKGTQAEHVLILRGAVTGVIILGCGHLLRQRVERRSASSCGSKGFGRRWLSGAPVMCADWGGCENKVVLTGVGLGLVATLAAVWCRPAREPAVVDENVKRAVKIVQGLQLNATSRGKAEPARLRHELFGAL